MKFACEYSDEYQARKREEDLKASGIAAWHIRKADGMWEVFWWVPQ